VAQFSPKIQGNAASRGWIICRILQKQDGVPSALLRQRSQGPERPARSIGAGGKAEAAGVGFPLGCRSTEMQRQHPAQGDGILGVEPWLEIRMAEHFGIVAAIMAAAAAFDQATVPVTSTIRTPIGAWASAPLN
tara:strand:- start:48 stop:449 length:402 start_codon:yes stop_codon:yes gene_type:complete